MGHYLNQKDIDALLNGIYRPDSSSKADNNSRLQPVFSEENSSFQEQQKPDGWNSPPVAERAVKKDPLVERVEFAPLQIRPPALQAKNLPLEFFQNVMLVLSGELGTTEITVRDFLQLTEGSVIKLDKMAGESAAILLNGQNVGQAEVVVINDRFGLRVTAVGVREGEAGETLSAEKGKKRPGSDSLTPHGEEAGPEG